MNKVEPLVWPEKYKNPGYFDKVFRGFPFIGLNARTEREIKRQLSVRTEECLSLWNLDEEKRKVFDTIRELTLRYLEWKCDLFIPDDPFEIVIWDPFGDLAVVELLMEFEDSFRFELSDEDFAGLLLMTLIEAVDFFANKLKESNITKENTQK